MTVGHGATGVTDGVHQAAAKAEAAVCHSAVGLGPACQAADATAIMYMSRDLLLLLHLSSCRHIPTIIAVGLSHLSCQSAFPTLQRDEERVINPEATTLQRTLSSQTVRSSWPGRHQEGQVKVGCHAEAVPGRFQVSLHCYSPASGVMPAAAVALPRSVATQQPALPAAAIAAPEPSGEAPASLCHLAVATDRW